MNFPFFLFMKLLPKCAVSRAFGSLTRLRVPLLSALARNWFASHYKLDMAEAEHDLAHYRNIAELFIRRLKPGARPIAKAFVVSPVDGVMSQAGKNSEMLQAKGKTYTLASLLKDGELAKAFEGGSYATIYLAPFNYHRIHSPVGGALVAASYIPGTLWPVNKGSVERVENLFCVNERLISRLACGEGREILVVKVGATNVGRIAVEYSQGILTNAGKLPRSLERFDWKPHSEIRFEKGAELGRFEMGSTVILVANKKLSDAFPGLFTSRVGQAVRVGEAL